MRPRSRFCRRLRQGGHQYVHSHDSQVRADSIAPFVALAIQWSRLSGTATTAIMVVITITDAKDR